MTRLTVKQVGSTYLALSLFLLGCQTQMMGAIGCNVDNDCPNNLHCDSTGHCVSPPKYTTVTVAKLGDGDGTIVSMPAGINCGTSCSGMFAVGAELSLTATANSGSTVAGFSVGCNSNTTSCTLTPSDTEPVQVLVNFAIGTGGPVAPSCNAGGYCWENPRPQGNRLNKAVVVGTNDAWAVGDTGTIVHRTSAAITLPPSGVTRNLYGIWGTSTDLYIVGEGGTILHSTGGAFSPESSGIGTDLYDVAGTGGNVFAVGAGGIILKRNGTSWIMQTSPTNRDLHALTPAAAGELYAVGNNGAIAHYIANSWSDASSAAIGNVNLNAVSAATAGTPLYMTSTMGDIFRLSGGVYSRVYMSTLSDLRGISVTPYGIMAVGLQTGGTVLTSIDGNTWNAQAFSSLPAFNAIATGSGEVVTVGDAGTMMRNDGSPWSPLSSGRISQLRAVHAADAQHGWAVGLNGTLMFWNGTYWAPVTPIGSPPSFYGVFTVSATDAWAVGSGGGVWRWNGTAWSARASSTSANLRAVWGAAADQVYAVGDGGVAIKWDGNAWSQIPSGTTTNLTAVGGSGATDIWAAGDSGVVVRGAGSSFAVIPSALATTATVGGLWAGAANNVWFAADTSMFHYDGNTFSKFNTTATGLRSVAGLGAELWAVGSLGALVHWNGASWDLMDAGTKRDFYGVFLSSTKQWMVGDVGTLLSRPR